MWGGPSPLYLAERLSERVGLRRLPEARGPAPHRRPQDQQCARPGSAGPADGQARGSSRRPARASTGSRPPPPARCWASSASCTWAPRTCGASGPTSSAWACWAPRVEPVEAGARTLKEAVSAAIRDWVTNVATTHYVIGSAVGPAPYPALVRDLQRVIGDEARAQIIGQAGALPDRVVACVGGGSNAIGTFFPFVVDESVELVGVEAAGEGLDAAPRRVAGRRARGRAARRAVLGPPGRRTGRSSRHTRSRRVSTTRASAPSTPTCATPAGCATSP